MFRKNKFVHLITIGLITILLGCIFASQDKSKKFLSEENFSLYKEYFSTMPLNRSNFINVKKSFKLKNDGSGIHIFTFTNMVNDINSLCGKKLNLDFYTWGNSEIYATISNSELFEKFIIESKSIINKNGYKTKESTPPILLTNADLKNYNSLNLEDSLFYKASDILKVYLNNIPSNRILFFEDYINSDTYGSDIIMLMQLDLDTIYKTKTLKVLKKNMNVDRDKFLIAIKLWKSHT